ncbi:hypothetical protein [Vibrio vulnificus]|uniref:hypothetical protein n=1 Tax=Vibrio vulnificus TaxID=672 RepID=UPI0012D4170A|nr:hypothetical protein [Vibrio vulnificus]
MKNEPSLLTILAATALSLWTHQALAATDVTPAGPAWTAEATINGTIRNTNPATIWRFAAAPEEKAGLTNMRIAADGWSPSAGGWFARLPDDLHFAVDGAYMHPEDKEEAQVGLLQGFMRYTVADANDNTNAVDLDNTYPKTQYVQVYDESNNPVPGATMQVEWTAAWWAWRTMAQELWNDDLPDVISGTKSETWEYYCIPSMYGNQEKQQQVIDHLYNLTGGLRNWMKHPSKYHPSYNGPAIFDRDSWQDCENVLNDPMDSDWRQFGQTTFLPVERLGSSTLIARTIGLTLERASPETVPARWSADVVVSIRYD